MLDLTPFITLLHTLSPELKLGLMYLFGILSLGILFKYLGKAGIFVYTALCVVVGNIQVLKAMMLTGSTEPVAMGTVVFMTTFLATDILAERYGKETAQQAIWCGFAGLLIVTGFMLITLGFPPLLESPQTAFFNEAHYAMQTLFLPAPALFLASLIAYGISQYVDVHVFLFIKRLTESRLLWLRSFLSTALSTLIDNTIFSILAWKILAPLEISTHTLIFTYILGAYVLRLIITSMNAVVMYWFKKGNAR